MEKKSVKLSLLTIEKKFILKEYSFKVNWILAMIQFNKPFFHRSTKKKK